MNESTDVATDGLLHLRLKPLWHYLDAVREFCGFVACTFQDETLGQRVGLIVHELMENAVRYGDEREVELRLERNCGSVAISVTNTTTEERTRRLRAALEELSSQSAAAAYARALRHSGSRSPSESGLGLPRIRYEGGMELKLETAPGRVTVTAMGSL